MDKSSALLTIFFVTLMTFTSVLAQEPGTQVTEINETDAELNETELMAAIGNGRVVLYPVIEPGQPLVINRTLLVMNTNPIDVKISLNASEEFQQYVNIIDSAFVLQPNETKDARFTITLVEPGSYEGKILVGFLPNNNDDNTSGVGIASNMIIIARAANSTNSTIITNQTQPINNSSVILPNNTEVGNNSNQNGSAQPGDEKEGLGQMLPVAAIIIVLILAGIIVYSTMGKSRKGKGTEK